MLIIAYLPVENRISESDKVNSLSYQILNVQACSKDLSGLPFMMGEYTAIPFHVLTALESTQPPPLRITQRQHLTIMWEHLSNDHVYMFATLPWTYIQTYGQTEEDTLRLKVLVLSLENGQVLYLNHVNGWYNLTSVYTICRSRALL